MLFSRICSEITLTRCLSQVNFRSHYSEQKYTCKVFRVCVNLDVFSTRISIRFTSSVFPAVTERLSLSVLKNKGLRFHGQSIPGYTLSKCFATLFRFLVNRLVKFRTVYSCLTFSSDPLSAPLVLLLNFPRSDAVHLFTRPPCSVMSPHQ